MSTHHIPSVSGDYDPAQVNTGEDQVTHDKPSSENKPLIQFSISSLVTIASVTVGAISAAIGFAKAGDSRVAPVVISILLIISGVCFAIQFINGIRSQALWQRVIAVISALVGVFVIVMAVVFYQALSQVQMPKF